MRSRAIIGVLLFCAGPGAAEELRAPVDGARSRGEPAVSPEQNRAMPTGDVPVRILTKAESIPFTLQDNLVRIGATVNGRPKSAVLDSGAGGLIIDRALILGLGLAEAEANVSAAGAGSESKSLQSVTVADLRTGPLQFRNIAGYAGDLSQLSSSAGFPVDMLVGTPAFKQGAVTVDYPRRRITFGPSGSAGTCAAPIPLEIIHDVPVVELQFRPTLASSPVRLKMLVDLGTRHFAVTLGGPFLRTEAGKALSRSGVARQVGHGIGGKVQGMVARVAAVRIGHSDFGDLDVAMSSNVPAFEAGFIDGTLGAPLWLKGLITFDYPAQLLCITLPAG